MSESATPIDVLEGRARWSITHGDSLEVLRSMPDASADSVVTDPPAGISFMNKDWDKDKGGRDQWIAWLADIMREAMRVLKPGGYAVVWALPRTSHWTAMALEEAGFEIRDSVHHIFGSGFPKSLDVSKAIDAAAGAKRDVVGTKRLGGNAAIPTSEKGGTYAVGAGTAPAIDVPITAPATDDARRWSGFGTALKPAHEVWWIARKPLSGTVAANVLEHGTGALNIDGCRVATDWNEPDRPESWKRSGHTADADAEKIAAPPGDGIQCHPGGRWPSNVVFTHAAECERVGDRRVSGTQLKPYTRSTTPPGYELGMAKAGRTVAGVSYAEADGNETVPPFRCATGCPVAELDRQSGTLTSGAWHGQLAGALGEGNGTTHGNRSAVPLFKDADSGTASRFFPTFEWSPEWDAPFLYCAKAATAEREAGCEALPVRAGHELVERKEGAAALNSPRAGAGRSSNGRRNTHPTVKPVALMRWLVRLVTPPGGVVLDPFAGSGTTMCAASLEQMRAIGCELDEHHCAIIRARVTHAERQPEARQVRLFEAPKPKPVEVRRDPPKQASLF